MSDREWREAERRMLLGDDDAKARFIERVPFRVVEERVEAGELDTFVPELGANPMWHPLMLAWAAGARLWGQEHPGTGIDCNPTWDGRSLLSRHVRNFREARESESDHERAERVRRWKEAEARRSTGRSLRAYPGCRALPE